MIFATLLITIEYILISLISCRWNRVDGASIEHKLGRFITPWHPSNLLLKHVIVI